MTSNEMRQVIGMRPNKDPRADELRNKNLNESEPKTEEVVKEKEVIKEEPTISDPKDGENQNG